jgi:hypothetical protein
MSSGRPKGMKNKASHSAGGARAGSDRKKKDNMSSTNMLLLLCTLRMSLIYFKSCLSWW